MNNIKYASILLLVSIGSVSAMQEYSLYQHAVERLKRGGFEFEFEKPHIIDHLGGTNYDSPESIQKTMDKITAAEDELKRYKLTWLCNIVRAQKQITEHCSDQALEAFQKLSGQKPVVLSDGEAAVVFSPGYKKCFRAIEDMDRNQGSCTLAREDLNAYAEIKRDLGNLKCNLRQKQS